jgi:putative transposase
LQNQQVHGTMKVSQSSYQKGSAPLRGPKPLPLCLDEQLRQELDKFARRPSTAQQLALRARIILAAVQGKNNTHIAQELGLDLVTVRLWRKRWQEREALQLEEMGISERLSDAPRSGTPPRFSAEQMCQIMALACEEPQKSGRPISHWTPRELAEEAVRRQIVPRISPRQVGRFLKRCGPQAAS